MVGNSQLPSQAYDLMEARDEEQSTQNAFYSFKPMDVSSIDQKIRGFCVFCGKTNTKTIMHHFPLPRWLEGEEVVPLCPKCHTRFEAYFSNFIKYGQFKPKIWLDIVNQRAIAKNWNGKNKEQLRVKKAEHARIAYWKNPEKYRKQARERFLKDPEKNRERQRKWYHNNPEKVKARRKANRSYYTDWQRRDRLKKRNMNKEGVE